MLLLLVAHAGARAEQAPLAGHVGLTREQVIADLVFFRDQWAPREKSFTPATREQMLRYVNGEIARAKPLEKTQLALVMSRAMAFTGNNHTKLGWWNEVDAFQVAPFSFWWFPEGAMVTRAHPAQRDLLGAKLIAIGGMPVTKAAELVAAYIPGTADTHLYQSPAWLRRFEVLQALGLSDGRTASFTFQMPNGRRVTRKLGPPPRFADPERYPDPAQYADIWRQSMVPGRGPEPWPDVLDKLPALPLYVQAPASLTASRLDEGRVLYVRSNSVSPIGSEPRVETEAFAIVTDALRGTPPKHVIVDLRYNQGGNFMTIVNFAHELAKMTEPDGRLYVITGRATNSAAIAFAALVKGEAPGRTKFVGEHPSDRPTFWSEGGELTTPSGIPLYYTTGFHDWSHGCTDASRCFWPVAYHGKAVGSLAPDIPVTMSFADYVAGRDPALEAALADISRTAPGGTGSP